MPSKKKSREKWKLDPRDVACSFEGSSSGKTGQFERKLKVTSCEVSLVHTPTLVKVEGEIPEGHYSKKEMQQKRQLMKETLFIELEKLVARKLSINVNN